MDNTALSVYMHELQNLVRHTQAGFEILNRGLQAGVAGEVLYGGQMLLFPASQLSSFLWPTRARARGRGEQLRKVLGLAERHALNDRRLSELWERGDEKFEEWVNATKNKRIVFDLVGDPFKLTEEEAADEEKVSEQAIFRCYDPETKIFYYRGIPYNIEALGRALQDVANRVLNVYFQMFPEAARAEQENQKRQQEALERARQAQTTEKTDEATADVSAPAAKADAEDKPKKAPRKRKAPAKKTATKTDAATEDAPKPKKRAPRKKKAEPKADTE